MLNHSALELIAATTLAYYNERAADFRAGTLDHDVAQNIDALLRHLEGAAPFTILDLGCGPGRDLKTFTRLGHRAIGLDGTERFVTMAHAESGCEVWQQNFIELSLPQGCFDGVYANAALFHVPTQELPRVLRELHATLKPRGVLFSSNPRGANEEGSGRLARALVRRQLHRARALLPARRIAARAAALVGERVAARGLVQD